MNTLREVAGEQRFSSTKNCKEFSLRVINSTPNTNLEAHSHVIISISGAAVTAVSPEECKNKLNGASVVRR